MCYCARREVSTNMFQQTPTVVQQRSIFIIGYRRKSFTDIFFKRSAEPELGTTNSTRLYLSWIFSTSSNNRPTPSA